MNPYVYDDGGRSRYFKGEAGDCVVRAISIAAQLDYKQVYDDCALLNLQATERSCKHRSRARKSARNGMDVKSAAFKAYMCELGFDWTPLMTIGSGCTTHLRPDELPGGRIICSVSRHWVAVINGVIHDTFDSSRDGTRCVYGYWKAVRV